jgi:hypothetical protein
MESLAFDEQVKRSIMPWSVSCHSNSEGRNVQPEAITDIEIDILIDNYHNAFAFNDRNDGDAYRLSQNLDP